MPKRLLVRASLLSSAALLYAALPVAIPAAMLLLSSPAYANGGIGGAVGATDGGLPGTGYTGAAGSVGTGSGSAGGSGGGGGGAGGGAGGDGGGTTAGKGGAGGTSSSINGSDGTAGTDGGGGGGGGGGYNGIGGTTGVATFDNTAALLGGNAGAGGNGSGTSGKSTGGGGGGGGGYGAVVTGLNIAATNSSTITGGNGGAGGAGNGANDTGGDGGDGGIGVYFANTGITFTNTGTITGGNGGAFGTAVNSGGNGLPGNGGVAVEGFDLSIVNAGTITGGQSGLNGGNTTTQADAIQFTDGTNFLTLEAGSIISGDVVAFSADDTLALGGSVNSTFDVASINAAGATTGQYLGFGFFNKTGTSTWTLTGTTVAVTNWYLYQGTLAISDDTQLGSATGTVTFDGGTLQYVNAGTVSSGRAITIDAAGGGTVDTDGNSVTLTGVISGAGLLNVESSASGGTLILTGTNTYTGGTAIVSGTLQIGNGGSSGSITGNVANDGTLAFDIAASTAFTGQIVGTGQVVQEGAGGDLMLTGNNTYSGGTMVTAGLINFTMQPNLGTGAITLNGGGLQWASGNTFDISGQLAAIGPNGGTFDTNGNNVTFATPLSGTGMVTKAGAGILTFSVPNTYNCATVAVPANVACTTVTGGEINFSSLSDFGTTPGSTIVLNGGGLQWAAGNTFDISDNLQNIGTAGGTFDTNGNNVSFASVIQGPGGVTKVGTGTLIFANNETYQGGTTISGGTLQVGTGGTFGSISGPVTDNATLDIERSDSPTMNIGLSGNGQFTWSGPGTLTITGNGTFTGKTLINGPLVVDATGSASLAGVISGTGSLANAGTGTLTIGANNTYSGGTVVTGGLINFSSVTSFGTAPGPNVLLNGGGLQWASGTSTDISSDLQAIGANGTTFDTNGNNVTFGTALSGGPVTKAGAGVLTFSVANSYTGTTTVTGGLIDFNALGDFGTTPNITLNGGGLQWASGTTLDISSSLNAIGANGATFDTNGNNVTLATALTGAGGVTKIGAGTLTLTPTEGYTGPTVAGGGILLVNGSITSSSGVNVINGGTLAGSGTVPTLTVAQGGIVSPGAGDPVRALTVNGSAKFSPGSFYSVNVTPTAADKLSISGAATLAGTILFDPSGTFTVGQQFTVLTAAGGLNGTTFGTVAVNGNFGSLNGAALVPVVSYDNNDAYLTVSASAISGFLPTTAGTNQKNVAKAIDTAMTTNAGLATFSPLATLSPTNLVNTVSALSGETGPSAQDQAIDASRAFVDTLLRASSAGTANGPAQTARASYVQVADNGSVEGLTGTPVSDIAGLDLWGSVEGIANNADANSQLGSHATHGSDLGGIIGLGYREPDDRATVGLALGYGDLNWTLADTLGKGRAQAYQGGLYGSFMVNDAYVSGAAWFATYTSRTTRTVTLGGTNTFQAKPISDDEGVHLELGRRIPTETGWVSPYIAGAFEQLDTPAYSETTITGSSLLALNYAKAAHTDFTTELGAEYDSGFGTTTGDLFTVHARLGWLHDYSAGISDSATFSGFPGPAFTVYGASPSKDAAHALLGIEQDLGALALTLDAQGVIGTSSRSVGGNAGIALRL